MMEKVTIGRWIEGASAFVQYTLGVWLLNCKMP